MRIIVSILIIISLNGLGKNIQAQEVQWLSFNQLDSALAAEVKPVFLDFYTSWCTYCRKMDKRVFVEPEITKLLNQEYYAVKMDAESRELIQFDGQQWKNNQATDKRDGIHDLALLLGAKAGEFVPPVMVFLNKDFEIEARYFEYLSSKRLQKYLDQYSQ